MSNNNRLRLLVLGLFLIMCLQVDAQTKKKSPPAKQKTAVTQKKTTPTKKPAPKATATVKKAPATPGENEKKVRDIVAFLEYLLNTLGSASTSTRDKEVVIRESYTKIFRDNKVQIEDDLENRTVVTNKNVEAYLRDVDFFFKDVKFELNIESIEGGGTENSKQFYKVNIQRNMKGTTLEGAQVNNTAPRFVEVNYDQATDGLTIASIYTKGFDEKVALTAWWNDLSFEWKNIFQKKLNSTADSLSFNEIQRVAAMDSLDLSNNLYVRTLEPLSQLSRLRYLNLSATTASDLTSLRNLTELTDLSIAGTSVKDISSLRYAAAMRKLNISNTSISSLEPLQKMPALKWLNANATRVDDVSQLGALSELEYLSLASTPIDDISAIGKLPKLTTLNISTTAVVDIGPLTGARALVNLNIDSTKVKDLRPLATATGLKELSANSSRIDNLEPLKSNAALERIYCDQTMIIRSVADAFMVARPGVLVVYDSRDLKAWWEALPVEWKTALFPGDAPGKDDLARLANIDSINLTKFPGINTLEPLKKVPKLRILVASGTAVQDLAPVKDLAYITALDISGTEISDVGPLRLWKNLVVLKANNTKIENIDPLASLPALQKIYVDDTGIHDLHAREFLERKPGVLVVYKTYHVERWWSKLPLGWKQVFQDILKKPEPDKDGLHKLVEMTTLRVADASVSELGTLSEFVRLQELHFSGTSISDLSPLTAHPGLKSLHATNSPVSDLEPIAGMASIEDLDISGTPVADLWDISRLDLKKFSCSGTGVRKLDPLEHMNKLEYLDCSNTSVGQLTTVAHLPLKTVKCYNSRVSRRDVERLKGMGVDVVFY